MTNKFSLVLVALIAWSLGWVETAQAQLKLEPGEKVRVLYFSNWHDGTIVEKQGRGWLVDYQFIKGHEDRDLFARDHIRKLCEVDALDFARRWQSSNGKFGIEAALKGIKGDLEKAVLIKTDLAEIEVKINSLSENDIKYLTNFKNTRNMAANIGAMPAVIPPLPELTSLDLDGAREPSVPLGGEGDLSALGALPDFLKTFQQQGVGFQKIRRFQHIVATIPVGGPDQLVLITATELNFRRDEVPYQSQGYWVSLAQKKVVNLVAVSPEALPIDYDPQHKLLLTVRDRTMEMFKAADRFGSENLAVGKNEGHAESKETSHPMSDPAYDSSEFVLWRLQPGDSKVEPLVRWHAKSHNALFSPCVKIINDKIVLAKTGFRTYQAWNLETKQEAYSFKISDILEQTPILTPDRQSIIVADGNRVSVIKAENGEMRFALSIPEDRVVGANVDNSGTKLAALTNRSLYVWDLASNNREPKSYPAPLIGSPYRSRIFWVDDDHILIEGTERRILYRLSLKMPIWSYVTDVGDSRYLNFSPLICTTVGGMFFYVAEPPPKILTNGFFPTGIVTDIVALGAVKFPGPKVFEVAESAVGEDIESMYVLKRGVVVDLEIGSVTEPDNVKNWLLEKIKAVGWVYQPGSSMVIRAEMGTLPTRKETYGHIATFDRKTTTVTFTPHFARVSISDGDQVIWQAESNTDLPFFLHTSNLQEEINKRQIPQINFFKTLEFDPVVMDPEFSSGFGLSLLGMQGFEVMSITPPGRADDPWEAADKMEDEIEKSSPERQAGAEKEKD